MNGKQTTNWAHFILMRHSHEKGFALPIAMGMGLFLLLIATMMMYRSQNDRVSATVQKSTTQGLSAAETAISRYQYLLNANRAITVYKDCSATRDSSGTCPDSSTTSSWSNATAISGLSSCSSSGNSTTVANSSSIAWQDIDSSDSTKGQYRLISYSYTSNTSGTTTPGTGTLIVEGRVNQRGSGSSATQDVQTSTARLQVKVAVNSGSVYSIPIPGLWLTDGSVGNNTIDADVLLNDCTANLSSITVASGRTKNYTSLSFPSLPTKPTSFATSNTLGNHTGNLTLPRSTDSSTTETINGVSSKVYRYSVSSIDLQQGNATLTVHTGDYNPSSGSFNTSQTPVKVYFYLDGNIEKGGDIIHKCTTSTGTAITNCKPTDFQIFGYGNSSNKICTNGNNKLEAFIFAPYYTVGAAGAGNGGGFKGSVWAKDWSNSGSCGSNTSNTVLVQTATWDDVGLTPSNIPPQLGNISDWKRQEVP